MIKAVFFDLYFTLVRYEPSQEEIEAGLLHEFGIEISPEVLSRPLARANDIIYQAIAKRSLSQLSREEVMALYAQFHRNVLKDAGITAGENIVMGLLGGAMQAKMNLALYDDVIPAIDALKKRHVTIGLISNIERDMSGALDKLGLSSKLDVVVTSQDAGANKPNPEIFRYALRQATVTPEQSLYTGDQYQIDVLGARGAGMLGLLIDRADYHADITDCPRLRSLAEVTEYL
jgi:putative hydrolase of the HAD superfamily